MLAVRAKHAVHAFRDDDAVLTRRFPEADGVVCSRNWRASEGPAPNDPLASRFQPTLDAARRDESYVSRGIPMVGEPLVTLWAAGSRPRGWMTATWPETLPMADHRDRGARL